MYATHNLPVHGTILSASKGPLTRHMGILTRRGTVISFSPKGKCEESLAQFANGRPVRVHDRYGNLSPDEVERRARTLPQTRYDLFNWNCESFVRYCHGWSSHSPQVGMALGILLGSALLCLASG